MFHVEHTPVQKLPALKGPSLQQHKTMGINKLQGKLGDQLRRRAKRLTVYSRLEYTSGCALYAQLVGGCIPISDKTGRNNQLTGFMVNHHAQVAMTKGSPATKQINRFEKAGFSAAIRAVDYIGLGMTGGADIFQVSHLKNIQLRYVHKLAADAARVGKYAVTAALA